jgi:hypothetical protein
MLFNENYDLRLKVVLIKFYSFKNKKITMTEKTNIPAPVQFFLHTGLYQEFEYKEDQVWDVISLKYFKGAVDCYCIECERESTFRGIPPQVPPEHIRDLPLESRRNSMGMSNTLPTIKEGVFEVTLQCTRNIKHLHNYLFLIQNKMKRAPVSKFIWKLLITKIGQYPSFSDLNVYKINKYNSVLNKQMRRELSSAIGLASHDVGIGSYVYLRRVFENLIEEAHKEAKLEEQWTEEQYIKSRMLDRIKLLHAHLPTFLVNNPAMYSLLSKGVHELTETECLTHFDTLKIGIELILDEKLESKEKQKRIDAANLAIREAIKK